MNDFSLAGLFANILEHRLITAALIVLIVALVVAYKKWDDVRYFVMRTWHVMPLVGTVAKAARQYKTNSSVVHSSQWLDVEKNIADLYYSEYVAADQDIAYYSQCKDYLAKVLESGRKKGPFWVLPVIAVLLVMEAIGFAYVLGPFMAPRVSANNLQIVVWSLALILSLVSGFIAHHAGVAQHYNSLLKKAKTWFNQSESKHNLNEVNEIQIVHTYEDNDQPRYNQIAARISIDHNCAVRRWPIVGFYSWIFLIAVAAFGVRYFTLQYVESKESVSSYQASNEVSSPWSNVLPAQAAQNNQQARQQAETDMQQSKHDASLVTFIILSVVYIGVQFFAFFMGRNYGFAGIHSEEAWLLTHRFTNAQAMRSAMERQRRVITMHADHKLSMLRRKLMHKSTTSADEREILKKSVNRNFESYVAMQHTQLEKEREESRRKELDNYIRDQKLDKEMTTYRTVHVAQKEQVMTTQQSVNEENNMTLPTNTEHTISHDVVKTSTSVVEKKPLEYPDISGYSAEDLAFLPDISPEFSALSPEQIAHIWQVQTVAKKYRTPSVQE